MLAFCDSLLFLGYELDLDLPGHSLILPRLLYLALDHGRLGRCREDVRWLRLCLGSCWNAARVKDGHGAKDNVVQGRLGLNHGGPSLLLLFDALYD